MKAFTLLILPLLYCFYAKASMDCIWPSTQAGITLKYVGACNNESKQTVDSILKTIVAQLNKRDTTLKVLVLVNHRQLSFGNDAFSNFFSVAIDTLREIDDDYIFDYYNNKESISMQKNNGLNTFRSQEVPIDINGTYNKNATKKVGIKIIYDLDYRLGAFLWNDLIKTIVFAVQNPDWIKNQQHKHTVRYTTNGWYVALTTIDTLAIHKIIGKQTTLTTKKIVTQVSKPTTRYWPWFLVAVAITGIIIYTTLKYKSQ